MEKGFTLWECPPLRARITRRQCKVNQARARSDANRSRAFADGNLLPGRQECLTCPGIEWWAERTGSAPLTLLTRDILRDLGRKEELQRRLRGAEAEAAPRPPVRRARARRARLAAGAAEA